MSIQAWNLVWKYSKNGGSALLVLLAVADHINSDGWAWPHIEHLAQKTKLSSRQVIRVIKILEASGELYVEHNHYLNRYRINIVEEIPMVNDNLSPKNAMAGDKLSPNDDELSHDEMSSSDTQDKPSDIPGKPSDTPGKPSDTDVTQIFNNHQESNKPQQKKRQLFSINDAERLILEVTSWSSITPEWLKPAGVVLDMLEHLGLEETKRRLITSRDDWLTGKTKETGKTYSLQNPKWIYNAMAGETIHVKEKAEKSDVDQVKERLGELARRSR